jgi:D-amino-acid dehydrogenase
VVIAAGAWTSGLVQRLGVRLPMLAGRGYSFSIASPTPPHSSLYLTEAKIGATPFGERLRLAGTMELSRVAERFDGRRVEALSRAAARYLLPCFHGPRSEEWSGLRPLTSDGLPVLGRLPTRNNAYVATGHGMLGVTLGPASGHALAEAILGRPAPHVLQPFGVDRFARRRRSTRSGPASRQVRRGWARG